MRGKLAPPIFSKSGDEARCWLFCALLRRRRRLPRGRALLRVRPVQRHGGLLGRRARRPGGRATPACSSCSASPAPPPPSDASQCLQSCWRSIRRTASAGSSHDALKASALLAWPAMCDASPLCLRLVGRIRATATRRTGSAPRVFVTEPPQLDGRSQVGRSRRRRQGNDGLLAMGGGLASVVAAVLS